MRPLGLGCGVALALGLASVVTSQAALAQAPAVAPLEGAGKGASEPTASQMPKARQTAEEFQALYSIPRSLYRSSLAYWQRVLRSEIGKREQVEVERVESLSASVAAEESAWRTNLEQSQVASISGPSHERDLYILAQSLLALADVRRAAGMEAGAGDAPAQAWQAVQERLSPFSEELKSGSVRADIRLLAAVLLAHAELLQGQPAASRDLLTPVLARLSNQGNQPAVANLVLGYLLLGDAHFALFRYPEARDAVLAAKRAAEGLPESPDGLMRLLRMRLFWTHYRAGDYQASLEAFRESCVHDSHDWQTSPSSQDTSVFREMGRLAGTVLMRSGDNQLLEAWSRDGRLGQCRSAVFVSYVRRLVETGRFAEAVAAFVRFGSLMATHRGWPQLAIDVHGIAARDRPGLRPTDAREVVAFAAATLERDGPWMSQHDGFPENRQRRDFVTNLVLPAAHDFYEEAFRLVPVSAQGEGKAAARANETRKGTQRSLLAAAAGLYEIRLREEDAFSERPQTLLRLALSLAGLGRIEVALERSNAALDSGLSGQEERRSAFELRCELAKRLAWQERVEPRLKFWVERCSELVRSYPTGRSLSMLLDAVRDLPEGQAAFGHVALTEAVTTVARDPGELALVGTELPAVLASVASRTLSGQELLNYYAGIERLLRRALGVERVLSFEQAHYSFLTSEIERAASLGQFQPAAVMLEQWLARCPDNTFYLAALASLVERRYQTRSWAQVADTAGYLIALLEAKANAPQFGSFVRRALPSRPASELRTAMLQAGIEVDWSRMRLLYALALEATFRYDQARNEFLRVSSDRASPENAQVAWSRLVRHYLADLEGDNLWSLLGLAAARDGGLLAPERERAILFGLSQALRQSDNARVLEWQGRLRAFVSENPVDAGLSARIVEVATLPGGSLGEGLTLGSAAQSSRLSPHDHAQIRNIVSALLLRSLQARSPRGAWIDALEKWPSRWLRPSAAVVIGRAAREWGLAERGRVSAVLLGVARAYAAGRDDVRDTDRAEASSAAELVHLLVSEFDYKPSARDVVELVGPSRPILDATSLVPAFDSVTLLGGLPSED